MALFDKLNDLAKSIGELTSDTIESAKLNSKINSEKALIAEALGKIGKIYYEKHAAGEPVAPETEELMASVDRYNAVIKELEEQLKMLKVTEASAGNVPSAPAEDAVCQVCGTKNAPNTKFCGNCGSKIEVCEPPQSKPCPSCGASVPSGVKFCNDCGAKME